MKLQDLTIDQFQRIAALEFSPVLTDYDKRALEQEQFFIRKKIDEVQGEIFQLLFFKVDEKL